MPCIYVPCLPYAYVCIYIHVNRIITLEKTVLRQDTFVAVSYTHLRAHETREDLVCRLLLESTLMAMWVRSNQTACQRVLMSRCWITMWCTCSLWLGYSLQLKQRIRGGSELDALPICCGEGRGDQSLQSLKLQMCLVARLFSQEWLYG